MNIEYWSDYACPYCYIGETRLKKAIEGMGLGEDVQLTMRAFELDPTAAPEVVSDTASRFARKYGLTVDEAKERIEGISELGCAEGIDFRYANTQYSNTFDAHRLTKYAHSVDNTAELSRSIHEKVLTLLDDTQLLSGHSRPLTVASLRTAMGRRW